MLGLVTNKRLKTLEETWARTIGKITGAMDANLNKMKEHILGQVKIQTKSNQYKHNDHEKRLAALEGLLAAKLKKYHENLGRREVEAAEEAEKNLGNSV